MSRYTRLILFLAIVTLLGTLTACKPSANLSPTPTKTPAALIAANPGSGATPAPFYTPTPEVIAVGPDNFPPNVDPLTGLTVDDPKVLERRPLAIVVSNSPPDATRPQVGLNAADIVYEYFAEGRQTRYTAIYLAETPELVGSVRSCRPINAEITLMYDSLWVCSGYSTGTKKEYIAPSPNFKWHLSYELGHGPPMMRRVNDEKYTAQPDSPLEHTLFADPAAIWAYADEKGLNERVTLNGLAFYSQPPAGGRVAIRVTVDYEPGYRYVWEYDPASGTYLRFDETQMRTDGKYVDKVTGEQLHFENVVVIVAGQSYSEYPEDTLTGASAVIQEVWGQGPLTVFRDGMAYEGTWQRAKPDDMLTFHNLNGSVLPLKPGRSWYQILPPDGERLTVEP